MAWTMAVRLMTVALLGAVVPVGAARGQCEVDHLFVPTSHPFDNRLGYSVAVDGGRAVVGAYMWHDALSTEGRAFVFRAEGTDWVEEETLVAWDFGIDLGLFGYSVAIEDGVVVVGSPGAYDGAGFGGAAYVFRYEAGAMSWLADGKLVAADAGEGDEFGHRVAISGDRIVVGARGDDDRGSESGSVYVFRHDGSGWVQEQKLLASDGAPTDRFGAAVAVDGDTVIAGARGHDDNGLDSGAAYVFRFDGTSWVEGQKLLASDGQAQDLFGFSVALSGGTALIGALRDDDGGQDAGAVYAFRLDRSAWLEVQKILASDGAAGDQFGVSVAIEGVTALVGARWDDDNGLGSGSAYLFRHDGSAWVEGGKMLASDGAPWDEFGITVDLSGDTALVGAWRDGEFGFEAAGSAYVYAGLSGADCNANGTPDACDIIGGGSRDDDGNGIPDECQCPWDCQPSPDGVVGITDLFEMFAQWAQAGTSCDLDGGGVGVTDLFEMFANWGACP